jgi:hypothetical protein
MSSQEQQIREIARVERLRAARNWLLCLALVAMALGITAAGGFGAIANPENWSSAYVAFAAEGWLRWAVAPLLATSFALVVVGAFLHGLSRRGHGEV